MITDAIITVFLAAIDSLFSLLPSWTLTVPDHSDVFGYIILANNIVPVGTVATQIVLWIGLLLALRLWDFIAFVYHQFWGSD